MESNSDQDLIKQLQPLGRHFPSAEQAGCAKQPIKIAITGGAGQIGSVLNHMIAQGRMFGPYQPVILNLVELPIAEQALKGTKMELDDGAYKLLSEINLYTDPNLGFKDVDVALLVGSRPRGPGMERKELLQLNADIFKVQGKALNDNAKKTVKILVVGNPCNTNALTVSQFAPDIPKKNITCLTRLDQNRAMAQIAQKVNCRVENVKNVIIWGNHSSTQYPDTRFATVNGQSVREMIGENTVEADKFLQGEFIETVAKRGAAIIEACNKSSVTSAANAICDHMHDWQFGTKGTDCGWVSMGLITSREGEGGVKAYNIERDLCYSFPVTIDENGELEIVPGLEIDNFSSTKIQESQQELKEERQSALGDKWLNTVD